MEMLIGDTPTVLDTMAQHMHKATSGRDAHYAIATQLWDHLGALEYTTGRLVVVGADAELLAGAPPGTPSALFGIPVENLDEVEDRVLLAADLPPAGQWPHLDLNLRPADEPDLNAVDVVITNLPFADVRTLNRDNQIDIALLHHELIQEALSWLRPGGLLVSLAHRQLLEGADAQPRRAISRQADLVAAARLPASALRRAPLLDSPVDLLLLRRREPGHPPDGLEFVGRSPMHVHGVPDMLVNNCYAIAPWAMLGNIVPDPIEPGLTAVAPLDGDFSSSLGDVLKDQADVAIDGRLYAQERPPLAPRARPESPGRAPRAAGPEPEGPVL
jgi:SAM-dependent methyltransferase